ncbi:hypothetical protein TNCV_2461761 [Trichonephila clavipes]|nr:hypothetical protein TNCV_2461761 [Trichonephila clavipes]
MLVPGCVTVPTWYGDTPIEIERGVDTPSASSDPALSNFQLFLALKKKLVRRRCGSNAEVKQAVKCFFRMQSPEFFLGGGEVKLIKRYI